MTGRPIRIAVSLGDPAGIGLEVTCRAVARLRTTRQVSILLFGEPARIAAEVEHLGLASRGGAPATASPNVEAIIVPVEGLPKEPVPPGRGTAASGAWAWRSLDAALRSIRSGETDALVTAPIAKDAMRRAGFTSPGHTEYLGEVLGASRPVMMLTGHDGRDEHPLRCAFVTSHIALRDVPHRLDADGIVETVRVVDAGLHSLFGIARPRISVCGLNPHAGEGGLFGSEDEAIIRPAVQAAAALGIDCSGPFPADTLFPRARRERHDAVVAMYHDQGAIPVKLHSFGRGVNVTLGLPAIRTSPDHGTAFDIAGRRTADSGSMEAALALAIDLAARRARRDP